MSTTASSTDFSTNEEDTLEEESTVIESSHCWLIDFSPPFLLQDLSVPSPKPCLLPVSMHGSIMLHPTLHCPVTPHLIHPRCLHRTCTINWVIWMISCMSWSTHRVASGRGQLPSFTDMEHPKQHVSNPPHRD